ncbi:MAG: gamma-glutamyl-gamma-aminobutyrate hydrolase family protein [Candidatus Loosdrechtia sp.]|uniref:gamma-glutamyl-gamma-aminobutyrate hydrolase family protein n=1 Tax=Candidatus Loosdrechtia sp. TaxID=3101272 RepID=UPI003A6EC81A|nr:MAG: gamma-glutamyl-gamma-aminobutyrate hydrolase family protein [Candidatus Jettenia sp. AMX2]
MKPVIGINCDYEEKGRHPCSFLYRDYSDAIIKAGGIPILLPLIKEKNNALRLLKMVGGLLLTGGNDVSPERYGEKKHEKGSCVHPDKDISDFTLVQVAIETKKPILAICYGTQLINVTLGGSLIQDIPSEVPSSIIHKDLENVHSTHSVKIKKDSLLYRITGTDCLYTNSIHHQAIKVLGKGLKDTARSADGIIEAIEWDDYPFLLGVQWHPERMASHPHHSSLFDALIAATG